MPELPEVEHVKRQLEGLIRFPDRIEAVHFFRKDLRFPLSPKLRTKMTGREVLSMSRRAKYLLFHFSDGNLLSHLGMTGSWRPLSHGEERLLHDHVEIVFASGLRLVYNDPRRFGFIDWVNPTGAHPRLSHLGPEPLEPSFTAEGLLSQLRRRKAAIKTLIMDQRVVVGVGNIYASEALFRARIKPTRAGGRITLEECRRLVVEIRNLLSEAIESGGSTIRSYRGADGVEGRFQSRFDVYERAGEPCRRCLKELGKVFQIRTKVLGARSTYWCSQCQK